MGKDRRAWLVDAEVARVDIAGRRKMGQKGNSVKLGISVNSRELNSSLAEGYTRSSCYKPGVWYDRGQPGESIGLPGARFLPNPPSPTTKKTYWNVLGAKHWKVETVDSKQVLSLLFLVFAKLEENGYCNSYVFAEKQVLWTVSLQFIAKDFTDSIQVCTGWS